MSLLTYASIFSEQSRQSGLFYVEVELGGTPGVQAQLVYIGVTAQSLPDRSFPPFDDGIGTNGLGTVVQYGATLPAQGVVFNVSDGVFLMIALNLTTGLCWFGMNGTWLGDPAAGTGAANEGNALTTGGAYSVFASLADDTVPELEIIGFQLRATEAQLFYPVPVGFSTWES